METPTPANEGIDHQAQLNELTTHIGECLSDAVLLMRAINPNIEPLGAGSEVFRWVGKALDEILPPAAIPGAMLIAFEARHEKPMSFIDTEQAKVTLTKIANARRQLDGRKKGLIIPPNIIA